MSAARADILAELKLAPRWVLRQRPEAARSEVATQPAVPASAASLPAVAAAPPASAAPAPGIARARVAPQVSVTEPPRAELPVPVAADVGHDPEARRARIAALSLAQLPADIAACTACKLCATRHKVVPGVGDPDADWLFVGEAPGQEEDARGEPFVGQAGRLLDNMLASLGLSRTKQVYIANVLKCRPPNNRTPEPAEADACSPYLARQIELVRPKLVVALGKTAASLLLKTDASVASLRGRVHRYQGLPLVVTYHPAYLLRTLNDKAKAWEDLLFARETLAKAGHDPSP